MSTPYSKDNQDISDNGHRIAQTDFYPFLFGTENQLEFESVSMNSDGNAEKNSILDGQLAIDRIIKVWYPNHRAPIIYTVQERFRQFEFQRYQDITITMYNHLTSHPSELYKLCADYFVYGYVSKCKAYLLECVAIKTVDLKESVGRGDLSGFVDRNRRSQQDFLCLPFLRLHAGGFVKDHFGYVLDRITGVWVRRKESINNRLVDVGFPERIKR